MDSAVDFSISLFPKQGFSSEHFELDLHFFAQRPPAEFYTMVNLRHNKNTFPTYLPGNICEIFHLFFRSYIFLCHRGLLFSIFALVG